MTLFLIRYLTEEGPLYEIVPAENEEKATWKLMSLDPCAKVIEVRDLVREAV